MNGQVYIPGPDERLDINLLARARQQESETAALDAILRTTIAAVRLLNPPAGWPNEQHDKASTIDALEQLRPNRVVEIEDDVTEAERRFDRLQQGNDARRGWLSEIQKGTTMKKQIAACLMTIPLAGCFGFSSAGNEAVGQVKRIQHVTPMVCMNYDHVDLSLGVMRNGVGSMSKEDLWLYVPNPLDVAALKDAENSGALVKITYDVARVRWCVEEATVSKVEVLR